jgi:serine/threonine protein kinase
MSKCFNPNCLSQNPDHNNFCQQCGQKLLLKDHFRGIKYLGEGGFGRTFVGIDEHRRNSHCVIKQFLPLQQGSGALQKCVQLFEQEAELLEKLGKHPQIPDLLAFFEQDGKLYLIQEYIEGEDLFKELQKKGKFSEIKIKSFLLEMLPVLDFIHQKNIIHRDIKPENIIRRKDKLDPIIYGNISDLVLIDFGVSKQISTTVMTRLGTGIGTPGYAPPEQSRGMVNFSSDLYSLAVTAIRLLTGVFPEERNGSLVDDIFDLYNCSWIWKEWLAKEGLSISKDISQVLDRMLADKVSDRFQTAQEVLDALQSPSSSAESSVNSSEIQGLQIEQKPSQYPLKLQTSQADFTNLDRLLSQHKWQEADQETGKIICKIMGREKEGYLTEEHCKLFPAEELKIIDDLWIKYSQGKLGFSIQRKIYEAYGGIPEVYNSNAWYQLADQVGWRKDGDWLSYSKLIFQTNLIPPGHLPWVGWAGTLFSFIPLSQPSQQQKLPQNFQQNLFNSPIQQTIQSPTKPQTSQTSFNQLERLLAQKKWQEADQETGKIMCKIMGREKENWLTADNCKNFPRDKLKIIDHLWVKYSNGRFGFSVQKSIWINCGGKPGLYNKMIYEKFCDRIGWRKQEKYLSYSDLTFNINGPMGHLPWGADVLGGGMEWKWKFWQQLKGGMEIYLFTCL